MLSCVFLTMEMRRAETYHKILSIDADTTHVRHIMDRKRKSRHHMLGRLMIILVAILVEQVLLRAVILEGYNYMGCSSHAPANIDLRGFIIGS